MSKDKGTKNNKKLPNAKNKPKSVSAYKLEGKSVSPTLTVFVPQSDIKPPQKK